MSGHVTEMLEETHQLAGEPGSAGRRWTAAIVVGVVAALAATGVVLALTVFSGGDDAAAAYRAKVDTAMGGVVKANRSLSDALARLKTGRSPAAERAIAKGESATASARGAINALTVPEGSEQLATNARQTLSRESAYLTAVKASLAEPRSASLAEVQTLAANLTDAFDVVAPREADWSQSVAGADSLTAWATRTVKAQKRAKSKRDAQRPESPAGSAAAPAAAAGSTQCGPALRAGPNTSCAFAENVREAYFEAPGAHATVEVFSPTTGRAYTMSCSPAGSGVTCSGGNNASVSFGG
jgi:hypothetical protein